MTTRRVQHDGHRWRIVSNALLDEKPAYELERRTPRGANPITRCVAWVSDCQPDSHEPRRVFRDDTGSLAFYPRRGVIEVRVKHARRPTITTIAGIIVMCARAEANRKALDRAFKRRTGRRRS